jgi:squalene-hopene/tetraprenyl-beta-curcumene cyclase
MRLGSKQLLCACALAMVVSASDLPTWEPKSAAAYLDGRAQWWATWPKAARDHDTFCVSCHTALPYAISRSALRGSLAESGASAPERQMLANITKRVEMWNEVQPFYPDGGGLPRSHQSRTTEAILNALILTTYDAPAAPTALKNMWALQEKDDELPGVGGNFPWLNFHNEPWEADDSPYFGNALAAIAVGSAPPSYRESADVQSHLRALKTYLHVAFDHQSEINRVFGLWAAAKIPGLLSAEQKKSFIGELFKKQQPDGGWTLSSLMGTWKRRDGSALPITSDGYATGLILFVLQEAGEPRSRSEMKNGLAWLAQNQKKDGYWAAYSPNVERDPASDAGKFMSDAATAYAVLALTHK